MENKLCTLGIFLEIEGAFDKTTFKSMTWTPPWVGWWMVYCSMLSNREVLINIGGTEIEPVADRRCPQGGVLFPVMWDTVVDNRIQQSWLAHNWIRRWFCIFLTGKKADILYEIMQATITVVEKWCSAYTLCVNGEKTKLILFTRRRKIGTLQMLKVL